MLELYGKGVSNGIAIGRLSFYSNSSNDIPKYYVQDTESELKRYKAAVKKAKQHMQSLYDEACKRVSKNESVIFQTHMMILDDSKFVDNVTTMITQQNINAEFAVRNTALKIAEIFKSIDDEYLQQRYTDIIDAANTVIEILHPKDNFDDHGSDPVIIAAAELLPSETISFNQENLLGFVTSKGSKNSHTAILARTLGLPLVTQIKGSLSRFDGTQAIIDGQTGRVVINPDRNTLAHYRSKQKQYNKKLQKLKNQIGLPAVTKNGQKVRLLARVDNIDALESAKKCDAEGIGAFRTDYMFLNRSSAPSEEELFAVFKRVVKTFPDTDTVTILPILGAEKAIPYLDIPDEKNPAIGYMGIRLLLSNKDFFTTILRALYRASDFGKLSILLPMVNSIDEIEYVKRTIEEVKIELRSRGQSFSDSVRIGTLIQTPAAAIISDEIAKVSDFITIGSNLLIQNTLAMDRENQKLEYFYEPYHKAIMKLIKYICNNAHECGKTVTVNGELASDVNITSTLLSLGVDALTVVPSKLLDVKYTVRETDTSLPDRIISKF